MVKGKWPAPPLKIQGYTQDENRKKVVDMANNLLVTANHRAGDYSEVYYRFETVRGRRRDSRTGEMMSHAEVSLAVCGFLKKRKSRRKSV
jgi:hypothetical protein